MTGATVTTLPEAPLLRRQAARDLRSRQIPVPQTDWAYFLDFDGTLVEIASHPDGVRPDQRLRVLLDELLRATGGAVALITGRAIDEIDALLGMPHLAVAGQHGAERRDASGARPSRPRATTDLSFARATLLALVVRYPLLHFEDKGLSMALHYRNAPALASFAHRTVRTLQRQLGAGFTTQPGKRVIELKPAGYTKGDAIVAFMHEQPFVGRRPVFVGDDTTDEHGFKMVNQAGGVSVKVGRGRTLAAHRLPTVDAVHTWLRRATLPTIGIIPSQRSR